MPRMTTPVIRGFGLLVLCLERGISRRRRLLVDLRQPFDLAGQGWPAAEDVGSDAAAAI